MDQTNRTYIALDLKSFYASVECVERGLNPLTTNLVVADQSRSQKTICLAVSPPLRQHGIPGRPRLFQVVQKVKEANAERRRKARVPVLTKSSWDDTVLQANPDYAIDYLIVPPRMAHYLDYSARIYQVYLKYIAPEDMHVYSIDEVFMDVTSYLKTYRMTAHDLAMTIIRDVLKTTGITATAGIGTNLYLAKVAMDIVAKRSKPDEDGVRVAELDEMSYRKQLWSHRPLTDFWRVGRGYASKLEAEGLFTMGDIARCSLGKADEYHNEDLLYRLFGVNAELLIDHAWGWEPVTIADIKAYKPQSKSIGSGQTLPRPYSYEEARLVVREMTDLLVLDLVDKGLVTDQVVLTVNYDRESLLDPELRKNYHGPITTDAYGRTIPKHAHGSAKLPMATSSSKLITDAMVGLYERITNENLLVRKINVTANNVQSESDLGESNNWEQLSLFADEGQVAEAREDVLEKERQAQEALLKIQKKYGKNAILKGMNLLKGATTKDQNKRIGGHKA
ncbi:MAG: DNA methylase [Firmicutes bacterium]|nr:DNA methylase [Bacillota bacterium]NLO65694.1 DNA methylase [Bacillota bacterium]